MLKMAEEAELAFSRLLDVNNNIPAMDYGQGVYDDMATLQRNKIRVLNADERTREEKEDDERLRCLRMDRVLLQPRARAAGDEPLARIAELKKAMEAKKSEAKATMSEQKQAQLDAEFQKFEYILEQLQEQITEIQIEQNQKETNK